MDLLLLKGLCRISVFLTAKKESFITPIIFSETTYLIITSKYFYETRKDAALHW